MRGGDEETEGRGARGRERLTEGALVCVNCVGVCNTVYTFYFH